MSVFSPMDPRGPDQRRKQLIAKLAQQASAAHGSFGRIPRPPRPGSGMMSEGRAFRGAGDLRLGGKAHVTQSPNILQSVLARLGVLGHSHSEESSPGYGQPISDQGLQGTGRPDMPQGPAIPVPPGGDPGAVAPGVVQPPAPERHPFTATAPTPGAEVGSPTSVVGPTNTVVDPASLLTSSDPVPLGNGLYYDPATGSIIGASQAGVGSAAHSFSPA